MNILIVSNTEVNSFTIICDCVLKMPKHITWKILGNSELHPKLISLFGKERFIHVPISKLKLHIQPEDKPFDFLGELKEKYIIIPTDFQSLKFLSQNRNNFKGHIVCPLMDIDTLIYLDDKLNMKKIAEECQVRSPQEYLFSQLEKLPANHRVVIKPHLGDGATGVFISPNKQEAITYYEKLTPENKKGQVIQDFVDGKDFYYYAICHKGKILISSIIIPGRSKHFGTHFMEDSSIDESAQKIISHYQYSGPISIDFRISESSKEVYLIEINPRNGNNSYLFNVAHTNWLFELANISENPNCYTNTYKIITSKWVCYWKIPMLYFFYKWKLYSLWRHAA
jgi:predicted ATP-grasp superfamily ATP-dependent carboligase